MFTMTHRLGLSLVILVSLAVVGYVYQLPIPTTLAQNLPTATPYPPEAADAFRLATLSYQVGADTPDQGVVRILLAVESMRRWPTLEGQMALQQHLAPIPSTESSLEADLIIKACSQLPRNLTQSEWQHYLGHEPYQLTCPNLPMPQN